VDNFGIVVIDLSLPPTQILEKIVDKSKQVSFAVYAIMQAFVVQQRYLYQSLYFNRFLALRFIVRRPLVSSLCDVRCSSAVKNYLLNYNTNYFASFFFRYYANNPTQTKQQQQSKKPASSARSATRRKKSPTKEKKKIKIILIESVPNLGEKGEHVRVAKGFARNYLIPKRLAVYATPENIKLYEEWTKVFTFLVSKAIITNELNEYNLFSSSINFLPNNRTLTTRRRREPKCWRKRRRKYRKLLLR
jgi:hypothetical protein